MIESAPMTFMPIQTPDLHRVKVTQLIKYRKGVLKMFKQTFLFIDELSAALDKIEEQKGQVVIQRSDDDIAKIADQVTHWTYWLQILS